MQINNPAAPTQTVAAPVVAKPAVLFTVVGAAWKRLIKGNEFLTISIGNIKEGIMPGGKSLTFNAGDKLFLRHNVKRPDKASDPDFQVCISEA